VALVAEHAAAVTKRPLLVGVTGPVAVGKTTFAAELAQRLLAAEFTVAVATTDGFLRSNAELDARGLTMRKGFPESFDGARFARFLAAARSGASELRVPGYSHLTYDVTGGDDVVAAPRILIVEGVNVLLPAHIGDLDLSIYIDADDEAVIGWFCGRLAQLCHAARDQPASFFHPYSMLSPEEIDAFARGAWDAINAVNLEHHIRPTRDHADVVVVKAGDHRVSRVEVRQSNEKV